MESVTVRLGTVDVAEGGKTGLLVLVVLAGCNWAAADPVPGEVRS